VVEVLLIIGIIKYKQGQIKNICPDKCINKSVKKATLNALYDVLHERKTDNREVIREIAKYVNLLAGTYILDMLSYEEVYDKVYSKLIEIVRG
jgi:hypothetical protein